jgi:hypothetical protein
MKSFRLIALSALITIGSLVSVIYTSCSKDECKSVTCLNGGTCSGGTCTCPTGYTGADCGTKVVCSLGYIGADCKTHAFIGTWTGTDVCSPTGSYNVTISLAASSTDTTKVLINNPGGFGTNNTITGTLSGDARTITYTNQIVNSSTATPDTLSGTMTLSDSTHFAHSYVAKEGTNYTCSGNYTKQ